MHELSIAVAVVEAVEELAREHGADSADEVRMRIGTLAGVEPDALRFSFTVAQEGTVLHGASLVIEEVPAQARCLPCDARFAVGSPPFLYCPRCDGAAVEVLTGRELDLTGVRFSPAADCAGARPTAGAAPRRGARWPNHEEAIADVPCR